MPSIAATVAMWYYQYFWFKSCCCSMPFILFSLFVAITLAPKYYTDFRLWWWFSVDVDVDLGLGCWHHVEVLPMLWRNKLPPSSGLNWEGWEQSWVTWAGDHSNLQEGRAKGLAQPTGPVHRELWESSLFKGCCVFLTGRHVVWDVAVGPHIGCFHKIPCAPVLLSPLYSTEVAHGKL
jgi:hypothetical protein